MIATNVMTWEQVEGVAEGLGRKFTATDVLNSEGLRLAANAYATTYAGTFQFMVDMRKAAVSPKGLSFPMAAGVLNCLVAQVRRDRVNTVAKGVATDPATATQATVQQEPQRPGIFTIILDAETNDRVTLRLKNMKPEQLEHYNRPTGSQVLEYLDGPDNESCYRGFAFVTGRDAKIWKKFQNADRLAIATQLLMEAPTEQLFAYGLEYALVSNNCWVCGHRLTVPASVCKGIGPVCDGKF